MQYEPLISTLAVYVAVSPNRLYCIYILYVYIIVVIKAIVKL